MSDRHDIEDFLEFLDQPAEDDEADELAGWMRFSVCPNCRTGYPAFHSPVGTLGTLCDACGWSSDEGHGQ